MFFGRRRFNCNYLKDILVLNIANKISSATFTTNIQSFEILDCKALKIFSADLATTHWIMMLSPLLEAREEAFSSLILCGPHLAWFKRKTQLFQLRLLESLTHQIYLFTLKSFAITTIRFYQMLSKWKLWIVTNVDVWMTLLHPERDVSLHSFVGMRNCFNQLDESALTKKKILRLKSRSSPGYQSALQQRRKQSCIWG